MTANCTYVHRPGYVTLTEDNRACIQQLASHEPEHSDFSSVAVSRLAAVLVLIFERDQQLHVILTQRSANLRTHAGQTALPGGRVDSTDVDCDETAYREAFEEIGLPLKSPAVHTLCRLRPFISLNKLFVTPVVAFLDDPKVLQELVPSQHEVSRIFDHPLRAFLDPDIMTGADLSPAGTIDWPYDDDVYSTSDSTLDWLDGTAYRMHRFRSTASPIKGLTADIMILTASVAYNSSTKYPRYAPQQLQEFEAVWAALRDWEQREKDTQGVPSAVVAVAS